MARAEYKKKPPKDSKAVRLSEFQKPSPVDPKPIYVLRGTDPYLLDQGRRAVRTRVLGKVEDDMALMELSGPTAELPDVLDALRTPPFLSPRRLVLMREADEFVAGNREAFEKYLASPSPCGSLCLEVASWNESTRLAKRIAEIGILVACEAADPSQVPRWLVGETQKRYGKTLDHAAAQLLLEYLGLDFAGLLNPGTQY